MLVHVRALNEHATCVWHTEHSVGFWHAEHTVGFWHLECMHYVGMSAMDGHNGNLVQSARAMQMSFGLVP